MKRKLFVLAAARALPVGRDPMKLIASATLGSLVALLCAAVSLLWAALLYGVFV